MRLDHLPHGRLTGAVLVGLILALAVLIVAARGATTSESYYLALGDSITYGLQPTKAKPGARPSDFKTGYVDVVAARLRKRSSSLEVVNYGCPGESTVTFTRGRCPAFADRIKLHDVFSGSQLGAALAFLRAHPGDVSPITLTLFGNDWFPVLLDTCQGKRRLRPEARSEGDRGLRLAVDVDHPEASRGRADGPDRRHGSVESGSESARGLESDLQLARDDDRSSGHSVACPRCPDDPGLQSAREDAGAPVRTHVHLLPGRSPSDGRWVSRDGGCGAASFGVA